MIDQLYCNSTRRKVFKETENAIKSQMAPSFQQTLYVYKRDTLYMYVHVAASEVTDTLTHRMTTVTLMHCTEG